MHSKKKRQNDLRKPNQADKKQDGGSRRHGALGT